MFGTPHRSGGARCCAGLRGTRQAAMMGRSVAARQMGENMPGEAVTRADESRGFA